MSQLLATTWQKREKCYEVMSSNVNFNSRPILQLLVIVL